MEKTVGSSIKLAGLRSASSHPRAPSSCMRSQGCFMMGLCPTTSSAYCPAAKSCLVCVCVCARVLSGIEPAVSNIESRMSRTIATKPPAKALDTLT